MTYVAGIDGGQSSTIAVVGDAQGRIVGRGWAGGADEIGAGEGSTRMRDALEGALARALTAAALPADTSFAAVIAGVSGYEGRLFGQAPVFKTPRFVLMHDAPIAHAGALGGKPGVTILSGTGSVVYASDGVLGRTLGGWGYLFGDEGSAFWLVREALSELMRREDDGDRTLQSQAREICEYFGHAALRPLMRAIYGGDVARDRFASLAPKILEMPAFAPIAARGAERLGSLAAGAIAAGAAPVVACTGGVFASGAFLESVRGAVARRQPGVRFVTPRFEPAAGALLLAYREAGLALEPQLA
ncbi:MAG: hypothetical protein JO199_14170 [Candidatus Eremiobacteraeota bacterium]|nr:hypothetical protein [Candidatus Eremiobacteraeota bacterium]